MKRSNKRPGRKRKGVALKPSRYEIRLAGSGGQGIITAARILAEAISAGGEKYVCQTQSYGPEARGGASKAEIVVSYEPIDYPKAMGPDLLLAMNQTSCDSYFSDLKPYGLLVVDSTLVRQIPTSRAVAISFTDIAREKIGKELVANMVALGAVVRLSQVVAPTVAEEIIAQKVPKPFVEMNLEAFKAGLEAASQVDVDALPANAFGSEDDEL